MATREVVIPQRANPLNNLMNMAQTGNNMYQGGAQLGKFGGWLGDLFGGGEVAGAAAPSAAAPTTAAPTLSAPTVAAPSAAAPTTAVGTEVAAGGAAGSEYGIATLGPAAAAGAAGAFQIKANNDYQRRGEKAGNAPYAMRNGPAIQGGQTQGAWNSESIARRMGAKEGFKGSDLVDASKSVEVLPLSRADKDNILGKLGEAFNISKLVKFG